MHSHTHRFLRAAALVAVVAPIAFAAAAARATPGAPTLWTAANSSRPAAHVRWNLALADDYGPGPLLRPETNREIEEEFVQLSYAMVQLANASYADADGPQSNDALVLGSLGMEKIAFINPPEDGLVSPEALVAYNPPGPFAPASVVVAVRGSSSLVDWLLDFAAFGETTKDGTFQKGFHDYAAALIADVDEVLEPYCNDPNTAIWFTGHSLGGAAAQLLAYWMSDSGCRVQGVITFAAPTPGQRDFKNAYAARQGGLLHRNTHRWVHEHDLVPCMPAGGAWVDVGVRHVMWGGDIGLIDAIGLVDDEPNGLHVHGITAGRSPRNSNCEEEQNDLLNRAERYVDEGVEYIHNAACPDGKGARIVLGIFSFGTSELVCPVTEYTLRLAAVAEQLLEDLLSTGEGQLALHMHKIDTGYVPALQQAAAHEIYPTGVTAPTPGPVVQPDGCLREERCEEYKENGECLLCVPEELEPF